MKVGIRADHGGFEMKLELAKLLAGEGHEVVDFGNDVYTSNDDYPNFAIPGSGCSKRRRGAGRSRMRERGRCIGSGK
jgi:hypothetical protein